MHPELTMQLAAQHITELRQQADEERMLRELRSGGAGEQRRRRRRGPRLRPALGGSGQVIA
jgi:hypothetical protein